MTHKINLDTSKFRRDIQRALASRDRRLDGFARHLEENDQRIKQLESEVETLKERLGLS